jgi:hypothetical protein
LRLGVRSFFVRDQPFRVPHSAFGIPQSAFRNPQSAIRISFAICYSSSDSGDWNKKEPDTHVLAYVITAYVAP